MAEALGVPANTLARWERGDLAIAHPRLLSLALEALEGVRAKPKRKPAAAAAKRNGVAKFD